MKRIFSAISASFVLGLGTQAAWAQPAINDLVPPMRATDVQGVDFTSGSIVIPIPLVSFGSGGTTLSASLEFSPTGWDGYQESGNFLTAIGGIVSAAIRPRAMEGDEHYSDDVGSFPNVLLPTGSGYYHFLSVHHNPDGTYYPNSFGATHVTHLVSSDPNRDGVYDAQGNRGILVAPVTRGRLLEHFIFANGEDWHFYRQSATVTCPPYLCFGTMNIYRLRSIVSSRGYAIQFLYLSDTTPSTYLGAGTWWAARRVTAYNKAAIYCNEALLQECPAVSALPSAVIAYNTTAGTITVTPPGEAGGVEVTFGRIIGGPWSSGPYMTRHTAVPGSTVTYQTAMDEAQNVYISQITDADGNWNYNRVVHLDGSERPQFVTMTSTHPDGSTEQGDGQMMYGHLDSYTDALNRLYYSISYYPNYREVGIGRPEGNGVAIGRDERNNITQLVLSPKTPTTPSQIILYNATYPVDCMNPRTCNRPASVSDAVNNTWDYTYAPEHGGALTETGPAVPTRQNDGSIVNVRPQKRYEYAQRYAWISNGSGGYMQAPSSIWLMVRERHCLTTAASGSSCSGGAADEVVTDYDYGPDTGPNNLALRGVAATAYVNGASSTVRTCYGYDASGNRISETQPNANLASCP